MRRYLTTIIALFLIFAPAAFSTPSRAERRAARLSGDSGEVAEPSSPSRRPMTVPVPYFEDFEGGSAGWTTSATTSYCEWNRISDPDLISVDSEIYGDMVDLGDSPPAYLPSPHSGNACFWYGNPENGTFIGEPYDDSPWGGSTHSGGVSYERHAGYLTSPILETAALGTITLSFWTWWEVECIDVDNYDMMRIQLSSDAGSSWETIHSLNPPFSRLPGWENHHSYSSGGYLAPGTWIEWTFFLESDYAGHDIQLRFYFDTEDSLYNGFRGWFVDDIYVSGGLEEAQLLRSGIFPGSLGVIDCHYDPNPFIFDFIVENIGGESAHDVTLKMDIDSGLAISSGMDSTALGDVTPGEVDTARWLLEVTERFVADTTLCWSVHLNSADSLIGYQENFEDAPGLFTGTGGFDYSDVRLPFGPDSAVSGFGVASIPSDGSATYSGGAEAILTSEEFVLDGWSEAYLAFWYWLAVPPIDPLGWSDDGEDGFLLEYRVNGGGWSQLDEFGVGILNPRYDAYIDDWLFGHPILNRMAYCDSTGRWKEVISQDLIGMGIADTDDTLQIRFIFGSSDFDQRAGLFLDEFRLSTVQHPIGPFIHTFCVDVPGVDFPTADLVTPPDSASSSCSEQEIVLNAGSDSGLDSSRVVLHADDTLRFAVSEGNLELDLAAGSVVATPSGSWGEGWHSFELDSCFNLNGCNIEPLEFAFLSDFTPPDIVLFYPSTGIVYNDELEPVSFEIFDTLTGLDTSSVFAIFGGGSYDISHPALEFSSGLLNFHPGSTSVSGGWNDCDSICISVADLTELCGANIDTACFSITVIFGPPDAALIEPPNGAISACEYQPVIYAVSDSEGVDHSRATMIVNSVRYDLADPELSYRGDTLIFEPASPWNHGDTTFATLAEFYDIHDTPNAETLDVHFISDLRPPEVAMTSPVSGSVVEDSREEVYLSLRDAPAGVDLTTLTVDVYGHTLSSADYSWTESGGGYDLVISPEALGFAFDHGDTVDVSVSACDMPDICTPNCSSYVFDFTVEPIRTCDAAPNPFSANGDGINDRVVFDYPHSFVRGASISIFDLRNHRVREMETEANTSLFWDGKDQKGNFVAPGLYLYIISSNSRVVCNGTILLVR